MFKTGSESMAPLIFLEGRNSAFIIMLLVFIVAYYLVFHLLSFSKALVFHYNFYFCSRLRFKKKHYFVSIKCIVH